jgi:hypothetical protein
MEQSPSEGCNVHSYRQEIPLPLWKPKILLPPSQEPTNSEDLCDIY